MRSSDRSGTQPRRKSKNGTGNMERVVKVMENKTCGTCLDNDCGLCDRLGTWVEDEDDACEKHRNKDAPGWREQLMERFLMGY